MCPLEEKLYGHTQTRLGDQLHGERHLHVTKQKASLLHKSESCNESRDVAERPCGQASLDPSPSSVTFHGPQQGRAPGKRRCSGL